MFKFSTSAVERNKSLKRQSQLQQTRIFFFTITPHHQKSGGVLCYTLWNFECPSVSAPTIRLPATPPTVLGQSFSNFTGAFRMVWRYAYCFFRILKLVCPPPPKKWRDIMLYPLKFWVSVCSSVRHRPHHSFARNSSYSFRPILFKLYRRF